MNKFKNIFSNFTEWITWGAEQRKKQFLLRHKIMQIFFHHSFIKIGGYFSFGCNPGEPVLLLATVAATAKRKTKVILICCFCSLYNFLDMFQWTNFGLEEYICVHCCLLSISLFSFRPGVIMLTYLLCLHYLHVNAYLSVFWMASCSDGWQCLCCGCCYSWWWHCVFQINHINFIRQWI